MPFHVSFSFGTGSASLKIETRYLSWALSYHGAHIRLYLTYAWTLHRLKPNFVGTTIPSPSTVTECLTTFFWHICALGAPTKSSEPRGPSLYQLENSCLSWLASSGFPVGMATIVNQVYGMYRDYIRPNIS